MEPARPSQIPHRRQDTCRQRLSQNTGMKRNPPKTKNKIRRLVFLFDVDNTLLDNDRVIEDLRTHLRKEVGRTKCERYWKIFEKLRSEVGFADYLGALQR